VAKVGVVLIKEEDIQRRVKELAAKISADYQTYHPVFVGILRGAFVFLADLLRNLTVPATVDFITISGYGEGTKHSGAVRLLSDLNTNIEGQDVIVVEDIVDTGLTLNYLLEIFRARKPNSLTVCALLDKREKRKVAVPLTYVGFQIPNQFVVGYGLDYKQENRQLPYIAVLEET
jgi:hypoxanthine phosphoribosyltransferase